MSAHRSDVTLRGLAGKKVLITGACKGQGLSHALAFGRAGCDIAALDITHPVDEGIYAVATQQMMDDTISAIEALGQRCVGLPCDVRVESQVKSAVERALDTFDGEIDIVVNNAGVAALDAAHTMRPEVLDAVIDTNLKGAMHVTKYAVPNMIERRTGRIINISSAVTGKGGAMLSHYAASKYGINGLTVAWANEFGEFGINVNTICPATIRPGAGQGSGMVLGLAEQMDMEMDEAYEMFSSRNNLAGERWRVESRHITDAVLFLASNNAEMITGVCLPVDAGHMVG